MEDRFLLVLSFTLNLNSMKQFLVIVCAFLLLTSCSSDEKPAKAPNVYVVGNGRIEPGGNNRPILWSNGKPQFLSSPDTHGMAVSVAVSNKDVHVVGHVKYGDVNGVSTPTYWKNGVIQPLEMDTSSDGGANSISIYNNDVYISGYVNGKNCYWKNGALYEIDNLNGVSVSDMVVNRYGTFLAIFEGNIVKLWKNGVITTVFENPTGYDRPRGFYVDNDDVYFLVNEEISGIRSKIKYWKNGVTHYISNDRPTFPSTISGFKGNAYVSGMYDDKPVYWVNGKRKTLSTEKQYEYVWGLVVFKGDVYCSGSSDGDFKLWKNGKKMKVEKTNIRSFTEDIAVAE